MTATPARIQLAPDWHTRAACIGVDPEAFFPEKGDHVAIRAVKRICDSCPVKDQCLEAALREEANDPRPHGIRGGMTACQRRAMTPRPRQTPFGRGRRSECDFGHPIETHSNGKRFCSTCRREVRALHARAAKALGIPRDVYTRTHGHSRETAEAIIRDHERSTA